MELRPTTELLRECRSEAFHLEVLDTYGVPDEDEAFRAFVNGEPYDYRAWFHDWYTFVEDLMADGVSVSRVRVVTVPHSDYQRWSLVIAALNVEAGEDIRYLPRHLAGEVPSDDYWLLDNKAVAFNLSDKDGRGTGSSAVTTDPVIVGQCLRIKEQLWGMSTPYPEYAQ
ncbi:DUF6879 family protein [Nocardia beijingensis]|uniref:DUF6879 family protein n=1 Tax=Nocardia beijingensis TaxID=95162 RepID=UPI00082B4E4A|nr:DUF6879 family protein [Nocardia beijingensis]